MSFRGEKVGNLLRKFVCTFCLILTQTTRTYACLLQFEKYLCNYVKGNFVRGVRSMSSFFRFRLTLLFSYSLLIFSSGKIRYILKTTQTADIFPYRLRTFELNKITWHILHIECAMSRCAMFENRKVILNPILFQFAYILLDGRMKEVKNWRKYETILRFPVEIIQVIFLELCKICDYSINVF